MQFTVRKLVAALGLSLSFVVLPGCEDFRDDDASAPVAGNVTGDFVAAEGINLHLLKVRGDSIASVGTASLPAGLAGNHTIFSITKHPTKPWLYVTSFLNYDWGNSRIDRFVIGRSGISHDKLLYRGDDLSLASSSSLPASCAGADDGAGNYGGCAPVKGTFNADGSRFYVQEDSSDVLQVYAVDAATGDLTFLWEGSNPGLHGLVKHPVLPYVYNGSNVFDVTGDIATNIAPGTEGNDTRLVTAGGNDYLVSTTGTNGIGIYSLAVANAPATLASASLGSNKARAFDIGAAFDGVIVVGQNTVTTFGFDGTALMQLDQEDQSGGTIGYENREVALSDDGRRAVVAWFETTNGTGGFSLFSIDDNGVLAKVDELAVPGIARVVEPLN